ncbi:MAG: hypothetical protein CMC13_13095 [Flavobacteriaceae bacterium]|mgnify:CR=1 FL=1|nr:hypothetical protein [Flavobacteriaceae bacterium]|tara:strand:+ start:1355 stop:2017 length:663 start_codon:yes stop_codon:yes gene_type:complete
MKLAVFDICGTLYASNTTYDFMLFYFQHNNPKKYSHFKRCFSLPAKVLWKFASLAGSSKSVRNYLIGFIKNELVIEVEREAERFVTEMLASKKIAQVHDRLESLKQQQTPIMLASASIEPVVKAIAKRLDIPYFMATTLSAQEDRYTGNIKSDLEGNKHLEIATFARVNNFSIFEVFTDNKEDLALLQMADRAHVVTSSANLAFWKDAKLDVEKTEIINK